MHPPQPITEDAAAALPELEEAVTMAEKFLRRGHSHLMEYCDTLAKYKAALTGQGKPDGTGGGG